MSSKKANQNQNHKNGGSSTREQLTALMPKLSLKTPFGTTLPMNAGQWKTDGFDHINISRYGNDRLGQLLDIDYIRMFNHPLLGGFKSLNALWHFIRAKHPNDHIRTLVGGELRNFVREKCGGVAPVVNFRAIIMHSAYLRVKADRGMSKMMVESTLPFDCYRTIKESGIRMRFEHSNWLIGGYEEIRAALKEKREPNFDSITDKKTENLYEDLIRKLAPDPDPNPDMPVVREKNKSDKGQEKGALMTPKTYDIASIDENSAQPEAASVVEPVAEAVVEETSQPAAEGNAALDEQFALKTDVAKETTIPVSEIAAALEEKLFSGNASEAASPEVVESTVAAQDESTSAAQAVIDAEVAQLEVDPASGLVGQAVTLDVGIPVMGNEVVYGADSVLAETSIKSNLITGLDPDGTAVTADVVEEARALVKEAVSSSEEVVAAEDENSQPA